MVSQLVSPLRSFGSENVFDLGPELRVALRLILCRAALEGAARENVTQSRCDEIERQITPTLKVKF